MAIAAKAIAANNVNNHSLVVFSTGGHRMANYPTMDITPNLTTEPTDVTGLNAKYDDRFDDSDQYVII